MVSKAVDVTAVEVVGRTSVRLMFDDGVTRIVNLKPLMRGPVFEQVFAKKMFNKVAVSADEGTIVWPNGASLDPYVLRFLVDGVATRRR